MTHAKTQRRKGGLRSAVSFLFAPWRLCVRCFLCSVSAPKARQHTSLGRSPRYWQQEDPRAEGPVHPMVFSRNDAAGLQPCFPFLAVDLGRWPRLVCRRAFGPPLCLSFLRAFVPSCLRVKISFAALRLCVRYSFLCVFAMGGGMGTAASAEGPLPEGWSPDLSQVAQYFEKELQDPAICQADENRVSGCLANVRDAQLALLYVQLWHQLPKAAQVILAKEQAAWFQKRDQDTTKASHEYEGGTIAPYMCHMKFLELTELRIKELQARIKPSANKPTK